MIEKKTTLLSPRAWTDVGARITASNDRVTSVTSPDSSWFSENRKPARPLEAWYVYPVIPGWPLFPFRFDRRRVGGEGRSRKQLERRWRLHETAEALEEIPSSGGGDRIDRQRRAAVDKQPRIPTLSLFTPNWNSIFGGRAGGLAPKELKPVTLWWIIFKGKI